MSRRIVVAGALGVVGRAVVEHIDAIGGDNEVTALSRRSPDFETGAHFVSVDLRDSERSRRELAQARDATHLVYAALHEKPRLVRGWFDPDQIETNRRMLENTLDALPALEHVTLLQGTKAYGAHLGVPIRVPAREEAPHREHANFYWEQEDLLRARAERDGFHFTIFRPQIVLGVASGSAMNPVASFGAFAVLRRELGLPLVHPGHPHALTECTDARLQASAIEWAWDAKTALNETFNVTNGDVVVWSEVFPALAQAFGMELGEPEAMSMADEMPRHAALWRQVAEREGLIEPDLDAWIGLSWQYADALWANPGLPERPALVSTIKLRQAGFGECIDTEQSILEAIAGCRRAGYLPER
jgi:nucleoside-diphosphate-sugar epimerase